MSLHELIEQPHGFERLPALDVLRERVEDWRGLLRLQQGQQILRRLFVDRLTLTPDEQKGRRCYTFSGTATLGKLVAGVVPHKLASPAGFEPAF